MNLDLIVQRVCNGYVLSYNCRKDDPTQRSLVFKTFKELIDGIAELLKTYDAKDPRNLPLPK